MTELEFTDRYDALGVPRPYPETMCRGQCEGTGWYPENDQNSVLWQDAHAKRCNFRGWLGAMWENRRDPSTVWYVIKSGWKCDGWHFVKCPDCDGTGKRKPTMTADEQLAKWLEGESLCPNEHGETTVTVK